MLVYSFWDDCSRDVSLMIHADLASMSPVLCVRHVTSVVLHNTAWPEPEPVMFFRRLSIPLVGSSCCALPFSELVQRASGRAGV